MAKQVKSIFTCQNCGYKTGKWLGRCPDCGRWDSMVEEVTAGRGPVRGKTIIKAEAMPITSVELVHDQRLATRIGELDRVLGGGLVPGSLVLIGGDPGIGKSTLMLQALCSLAAGGSKVLYVSGEESVQQLRLRSLRLKAEDDNLLVAAEVDLDAILAMADSARPDVLVVDSIQTVFSSDLTSAPGSVTQVRESAMRLMMMAKQTGLPTFLVGHVTKEGAIAGPKLLEHMVDTVLYFEGDRNHVFRILRAVKNRFGSTNEIGVFEMRTNGLKPVPNPSAVFLSGRKANTPGSVVAASMEGSRPILVEIQALASGSHLGTPRRTVLGLDANRVALLVAVMEKKLGMHLSGHDIFMNVAGGVRIMEPAVDLAVIAAVASSFLDKGVEETTMALGEVGLTGEVRAIGNIETRIGEAHKMGFKRCIAPAANLKSSLQAGKMELVGVQSLAEAMEALF